MASKHVVEVNDLNFEREVLQSSTPVLVDFTATWCGPCRQLAPIVDEIAEEASGEFKVAKLDIDQAPAVTQRYGIRGVPTVIAFRGGEPAGRQVGLANKKTLLALVGR
jgi:thioredoxin 1